MDKTTCLISVCSYLRKCELAAFDELCWLVSNQMADPIFSLWNWGTASIVLKYGRLNMEPACLGCLPAGRSGNIIISSNHVFAKEITGAERKNRILWEFTLLCFHICKTATVGAAAPADWNWKLKIRKRPWVFVDQNICCASFKSVWALVMKIQFWYWKKWISFVLYWFAI